MSQFSNQLAWAAKTAQKVLAPMTDPDDNGEITISGLTGTWTGICAEDPNMLVPTPNGYQKTYGIRVALQLAQFTDAQLTTLAALAGTRANVTARGKSWSLIEATHQAQFVQLVAVAT